MADLLGYLKALLYVRRRAARPDTYGHGFGIIVAFLNGALLIRFAANIYIMLDLTVRRVSLGWGAFLAASLGVLAAYGVSILPLSSYRYLHDSLKHRRLHNSPYSRTAKTIGLVGSVLFRPITGGMFGLATLAVILSASLSTDSAAIALLSTVFVIVVIAGAAVVVAVMSVLRVERGDCEYLEIGFLVVILLSNFDVRVAGSQAELIFFLSRLPEWSAVSYVMVPPAALTILAVALVATIHLMKIISSNINKLLDSRQLKRSDRNPIAATLYVKRSKLWFWILIYAVVIPILTSAAMPSAVKRWSVILLLTFSFVGFARFAAVFENEVSEKLLFHLDRHHRLRLFGIPLLMNGILSMVPILAWLFAECGR
jgi:hypothetical protein